MLTLAEVRRAVRSRASVVGALLGSVGLLLLICGFEPAAPTRVLGAVIAVAAAVRTARELAFAESIPDEIALGHDGLQVRRDGAERSIRWDEIHRVDRVDRFEWLGLPRVHSTWAVVQLMSGGVLRVHVDEDTWNHMVPWMRHYRLVPWMNHE